MVSVSNTPAQLRTRKNGIDKMIRHAVMGMLPLGPLGRHLLDNLYVIDGTELNGLEGTEAKGNWY